MGLMGLMGLMGPIGLIGPIGPMVLQTLVVPGPSYALNLIVHPNARVL